MNIFILNIFKKYYYLLIIKLQIFVISYYIYFAYFINDINKCVIYFFLIINFV